MKKILFLLSVFLLLPISTFAYTKNTYELSNGYPREYLKQGYYKNTFDKFLISNTEGIISKDEYNATIKNGGMFSYLFDGGSEFWTNTSGNGSTHYAVTKSGVEAVSNDSSYYTKVTANVKNNIKVSGSGTLDNPWTFDPVYKVTLLLNSKYANFDETKVTQYVTRYENGVFNEISPKSGYVYLSNNCAGSYDKANKKFTINHVSKEINCQVVFGNGNFEISLLGANPSMIYSKLDTGFFSDAQRTKPIYKINSAPTKAGYKFKGYYYNNIQIVDENLKVITSASSKIKENITAEPRYQISDLTGATTISGGTTKVFNRGTYSNGVFTQDKITLTCNNSTEYASGTTFYYQFARKRTGDADYTWLETPSTSNKASFSSAFFYGIYDYTCRVYASDGTNNTNTKDASTPTRVELYNARVDFDLNGGTLATDSGPLLVYAPFNGANFYKIRTGSTVVDYPVGVKASHQFIGWYTAAEGGQQVIDSQGQLQSGVAGWTAPEEDKWAIDNTSNSEGTNKLYAQYDGNTYVATFIKNGATSIGKTTIGCKVTDGTSCTITLPSITRSGFDIIGWSTNKDATTGAAVNATVTLDKNVTYYAISKKVVTGTFYYNSNTTAGSLTVSNKKSTCTIKNAQTTCTLTLPTEVSSSKGKQNSAYKGIRTDFSSMAASSSLVVNADTKYYANYSSKVTNYYYNATSYTSRTIYRNEYFTSATEMISRLATSNTSTANYTTATGPGSSTWSGLSTAKDTTEEYTSIQKAADSSYATLYTVYKFDVTFNKGSNVDKVGSTSGSCKVTTDSTSCTVKLPTITPTSGYTTVGWSKTSGATSGTAAGSNFTIDTNNTKLYANAKMSKPTKPTIASTSENAWTKNNITLTYSTTTPVGVIGKWYIKEGSGSYTVISGLDGKTGSTKQYTKDTNMTVSIIVCNKNATSSSDTANCSDAASSVVKVDKTGPTIKVVAVNKDTGANLQASQTFTPSAGTDKYVDKYIIKNKAWFNAKVKLTFSVTDASGINSKYHWRGNDYPKATEVSPTMAFIEDNFSASLVKEINYDGYRIIEYKFTDSVGNTSTLVVVALMDITPPTCSLKVDANNNVVFNSKTDTLSGLASFGLTSSTTATYNSTTSLAASAKTFYGYVKDKVGITGKCSITVKSVTASTYTKESQKCNVSVSGKYSVSHNCTTSTLSNSGCSCKTWNTKTVRYCHAASESYCGYGNYTYNEYTSTQPTGCTRLECGSVEGHFCVYECTEKTTCKTAQGTYNTSSNCTSSTCSKTGCKCTYSFGSTTTSTNQSSCSTSSFTCNASNAGKSKTTKCTATAWSCENGYTKVNNKWCYK